MNNVLCKLWSCPVPYKDIQEEVLSPYLDIKYWIWLVCVVITCQQLLLFYKVLHFFVLRYVYNVIYSNNIVYIKHVE